MGTIRRHYSKEEKLSLLREYHSSGKSFYAFSKAHGISNPAMLGRWVRQYEIPAESLTLQSEPKDSDMANRDKESYKEEVAQLKKRIRELEKALAFSKLETEARDLMIDIAEKHFDIPIRKKSGAKQ